jgi:hypothetical protein
MAPDPSSVIRTLQEFAAVLDRLGITYAVTGSLAGDLHGRVRYTRDVDVIVDLPPARLEPLFAALEGAYYVPRDFARQAVAAGSGFNVLHLATGLKFDLFPVGTRSIDREQLSRRVVAHHPAAPGMPLSFVSAEVLVLRKLVWYRRGGEVSEQQWGDVQGVLTLHARHMDLDYMRRTATELGVADLLERALAEAKG